jgi:formylmethanofuran dehydrogenase subunit E
VTQENSRDKEIALKEWDDVKWQMEDSAKKKEVEVNCIRCTELVYQEEAQFAG